MTDPKSDPGADSVSCPSCGAANLPASRFCSTCATPLAGASVPAAEMRKTVTVLFCDAASSTALGERLDPESLRGLMSRYFDVMREVIDFHGGALEKFIGDAVMAVFGVPVVHEDDALRACRAAAEIRERLAALDAQLRADQGATIEWRMGINTGEVVTGDAHARQRMVTGDAVNVAARLEAAAAPGQTLMGAETHAMVRDAVTAEQVEPLTLKGKSGQVPAWRLVSVKDELHRHARPLEAPLVGRRRPLRLLDDAFQEAVEERVCHLFTILGEAGVGKSRLVEEFIDSLGDEAGVATGRCLAYGRGITYWPVGEALRDGARLAENDPPETTARRLRDLLGPEPDADRIADIVGGLLGIESSSSAPDEIFWAIRKTFEAMARRRPLILVFDDVHWGEPTFLDLVDHMADWTRDAPILLIAMARAELLEKRPAWSGGKRWATTMSLEPLSDVESEELVASLLGRAELPAELRDLISRASEGNPLFVEELLGKLIDDGVLVASGEGWGTSGDLGPLVIPPSVQALLAARLDGLGGEERAVIERAAVEGKVFHRGAVMELAPEPMRGQIHQRLASLVRMELVRPDQASFAGDEAYRFRHLLIRDVAYQAMAKLTRSELHERFAAWLERVAADRLTEYQEIVAYHFEQAYLYRIELGPPDASTRELAMRAGTLLADAGVRASRRGDVAATVDLLERAVELLPEEIARQRNLLSTLGRALYDLAEVRRSESVLTRAVAEADQAGDEGASALAAVHLVAVHSSTRSVTAAESLRELERLASILKRTGDVAGARLAVALAASLMGGRGQAEEAGKRAKSLVDLGPADEVWYADARMIFASSLVFGPAPIQQAKVTIRAYVEQAGGQPVETTWVKGQFIMLHALEGRFREAREALASTRAGFEELGQRKSLVWLLFTEGHINYLAGDLHSARQLMLEAYEAMTASGDRSFASTMAVGLSKVLLDLGDLDGAWRYAIIARDTSSYDDIASQVPGRALQARVLAERGEHDRAIALAQEAEAMMTATDYLVQHGEVTADLARVLRAAGRDDEATAALTKAASLYQAKGATVLENRARRVLAEWSS